MFSKDTLRNDISAGVTVFLVALPLCLGIALASGAPFFSGMIAGIVGGIVIGVLSNSNVSVSGPAAGLVAIVLSGLATLGSFETFLVAVFLAGLIQIVMGVVKLGAIAEYFPSGVIRGMLTAIGLIIIIKQIPHGLGYDEDVIFMSDTEVGPLSQLTKALSLIHPGALALCAVSLVMLLAWEHPKLKSRLGIIPGGLAVVLTGVLVNEFVFADMASYYITDQHLVRVPVPESFDAFVGLLTFPDFSVIGEYQVYVVALTIAIVASIETLLCIEATDRLDTQRRVTNTNRELVAQGVGNTISGLIGGLPITSVIVRSSANIAADAKTKLSTIIHGFLLLITVLAIPTLLNKIPLATLAAILLVVGYKLCAPEVFVRTYKKGSGQFIPFLVTVAAILLTDLLIGVAIGFVVGLAMILRQSLNNAYSYDKHAYQEGEKINIKLADQVTFLNKVSIRHLLDRMPYASDVTIDATDTVYMDSDVLEIFTEFYEIKAPQRNIKCHMLGFKQHYKELPQAAQVARDS